MRTIDRGRETPTAAVRFRCFRFPAAEATASLNGVARRREIPYSHPLPMGRRPRRRSEGVETKRRCSAGRVAPSPRSVAPPLPRFGIAVPSLGNCRLRWLSWPRQSGRRPEPESVACVILHCGSPSSPGAEARVRRRAPAGAKFAAAWPRQLSAPHDPPHPQPNHLTSQTVVPSRRKKKAPRHLPRLREGGAEKCHTSRSPLPRLRGRRTAKRWRGRRTHARHAGEAPIGCHNSTFTPAGSISQANRP